MIGEKHKLIPSVYAICKQKDGKISHSGPTFISIRSGKHDSSTASSHQYDFERLLNLEEFSSSMKDGNGIIKPLLFIAVDGGPDEAPSNQKTLIAWSGFFKRHDIDGIFIFNNAPGYSAYNKVERRMAPLSKDTSGIILPFDTFGSHLNSSNKTIDLEREKKNFEEAGKILASVWSETIIDGYPVVSEYQVPDTAKIVVDIEMDQFWIDRHVSQSRYILQITKCKDHSCCNISRTNYEELVGSRYLPPPIPLKITEKGPSVHSSGKFGSLFHNLWLSSVTKTKVNLELNFSICILYLSLI